MRRPPRALVLCLSGLACTEAPSGAEAPSGTEASGTEDRGTTTTTSYEPSTDATSSDAESSSASTTTTAVDSTTTGAPEPTRVLFIGNSYTFVNDLPAMLEAVADGAGHPLLTSMIAVGGARLGNHVVNPEVTTTLAEGWDIVVVQGQSVEPIVQTEAFMQGTVDLAAMIDVGTPDAQLLLYETWARREGDALLDALGMTAEQMQQALTAGYADAALASMGTVAPVGQTWALALTDAPQIDLFAADGSHPSPMGTYLASCVFFRAVTGTDAIAIETAVAGIDPADADALESIADMLAR